ncbi:zinc metalloprotease [Pyxidicoccus xibeiensis]|uniref:adhesin n=1 Tax=Pyxidicoccus xibeiensis TaxID=2906759 RepID=UPI0020A76004|nr:adhesin [Pyxidicoccus xibeiensis]MCP3141193.1 adhesin [Pyxidicoccus xibeiensis]
MKRGLLRGVCALGLCMLSATAVAQPAGYSDLGYRVLNSNQDPLRYWVDARVPLPVGLDVAGVEAATRAAFQAWEDVSCAWPDFDFAGRATNGSPTPDVSDPADRFTVVPNWVTSRGDPRYDDTLNAGTRVGAAKPVTFGGYVYQCDIYLNAVDHRWSTATVTPAGAMDLQSILMREIGHCLGLGDIYDIYDESPVMYFELAAGVSKRQLARYDRDALCRFYPQAGAVGSPCGNNGTCSGGLTCVSAPSTTNKDVTLQVCARGCTGTTEGECPAPYVCRASSAVSGFTRACLPALPDSLTPVGQACDGSSGSCGTSAAGRCIPPTPLPSGGTTPSGFDRWDDGYCTESCSGPGTCPSGSECSDVEGQGRMCLKRCGSGTGDCRPGYACAPRPEGDVCVPGCYGDVDCSGSASSCRLCDRVCVTRQASGGQVGDPCSADTQCGTNQYCLKLNGNSQGVCAQPCALQACACPGGTTCRVVDGTGERACMRDCSQGSCVAPLQCSAVESNSAACLPACRSAQDCPPNMLCGGGACYDPKARPDAGTCTLCGDAGPPPPPPVDAGPGEGSVGGPGGCGCQGAPVSAAAFLGALVVVLLFAGRRRVWHRQ